MMPVEDRVGRSAASAGELAAQGSGWWALRPVGAGALLRGEDRRVSPDREHVASAAERGARLAACEDEDARTV